MCSFDHQVTIPALTSNYPDGLTPQKLCQTPEQAKNFAAECMLASLGVPVDGKRYLCVASLGATFLGRGLGGACYLFLLFNGGALHEWVLKTKALHIFPWNIKLLFVCLLRTTPQVHNCLDYCPQDHYSLGLLYVRKQFSEECLDTFFFF